MATGSDRQYQESCRDLLIQLDPRLYPQNSDGIDIPVQNICGTTVTFDILLRSPEGEIVAAECKRWESSVPQGPLFEFATKCEGLREALGSPVAGIFLAKKSVQQGLLKVASNMGVQVIVLPEASSDPGFYFRFEEYDVDREQRIRTHKAGVSETVAISENVCIVLKRESP